jgi:hypothetical protein
VVMFLTLLAYTLAAASKDGLDLITPALLDLAALGWPGQFHLDFLTYLILSAGWIAWRHQFSAAGIALGLVAAVAGMMFFSVYLLIVSFQVNGDLKKILLGAQAPD